MPIDSLRDYQFIKTIGEGTFGKVKLGLHKLTKEFVAIKILEKSNINDNEELDRILKEIKYLKLFEHINIIQIYEMIETEQYYFIIMEYVSGGELFNYIVKKERIEEKEASFFFSQIIHGIKEINSKKICHRDIKPENLLLTQNKIIKIIDIGLSNEYTDFLSTQCGSPCYAAPEIIKGMKYNGLLVDLWAAGIILFAMLYGYLPFDDRNNNILFRKIIQCKLEFPDDIIISNEAKDLIMKILTPNPSKRISIDKVLDHPFLISGNKEYYNIINNKKYKEDYNFTIINYMEKVLRISNISKIKNDILNNKHNAETTTYKLIKKQIIEGRFDYEKYNKKLKKISAYISPIRNMNIKINLNEKINNDNKINNIKLESKKNHINNINVINNKLIKKDNNNRCNIKNFLKRDLRKIDKDNQIKKTHSTDNSARSTTNTECLSVDKKIKLLKYNDAFDLNKKLMVKYYKMNPLYKKMINQNKNFKRNIDTSISIERDKKKSIKKIKKKNNIKQIICKTPKKNPFFTYESENDSHYNCYKRKINYIFIPNGFQNEKRINNKRNNKNCICIQNPEYNYLKTYEKIKNKTILINPINKVIFEKKGGSVDKIDKYPKDSIRKNIYKFPINNSHHHQKQKSAINPNVNIYNKEKRENSPYFGKLNILDNNIYNNIISQKTPMDRKSRKGINDSYINNNNNDDIEYNNIHTIPNKDDNNNIFINTNINANIYYINNENNKKRDINKEKNKNKNINRKNNINKNIYTPLNKKNKISDQNILFSNYKDKFKAISFNQEKNQLNQINFGKNDNPRLREYLYENTNLKFGLQ